jgi:hypothetical protein
MIVRGNYSRGFFAEGYTFCFLQKEGSPVGHSDQVRLLFKVVSEGIDGAYDTFCALYSASSVREH